MNAAQARGRTHKKRTETRTDDSKQRRSTALDMDPSCEMALQGVEEVRHQRMLQLPNVASVQIRGGEEDAAEDAQKIAEAVESMLKKQEKEEEEEEEENA